MIALVLSAVAASVVSAHSWVECSDYSPFSFDYETLGLFDRSRCRGYPRAFANQFSKGFSIDTGYNWEVPACRDKYSPSDYNDQIVMATYTAGQTIYISHPAKNHVADTCTNPFIPSGVMTVKMSLQTEVDTFDTDLTMIGDDHVNGVIDHLEYQRCYKFCDNPDGAHCLTGWVLPDNIVEGVHSFIWLWEFNSNQIYSSCFDAYIKPSDGTNSSGSTEGSASLDTGESYSSSGSASNDDDTTIEFVKTTVPSVDVASSSPEPTNSAEVVSSVSPEPNSSAEVISSASPSLISPYQTISSYVMNITGYFNISGLFDVSFV